MFEVFKNYKTLLIIVSRETYLKITTINQNKNIKKNYDSGKEVFVPNTLIKLNRYKILKIYGNINVSL